MSSDSETSDAPDPSRIVAGADVLAADVLVGGPARAALDHVRSHSWLDLVASDHLLDDAEAVIAELADDELADDWRDRIERERVSVEHPPGDQPALASAYRGDAAHVLSFDDELGSVETAARLQGRIAMSVRHPKAFDAVFDAASLYDAVVGGEYPGPDRDPRE